MIAWTPPQPVSPTYAQASMPALVVTGDGKRVAAWHDNRGAAAAVLGRRGTQALPPAALEFTPVVAYGAERIAVAASHALPPTRRLVRLTVRLGRAGGKLGAPALDLTRPNVSRPTLVGDARGDLALGWFENVGVHNDRVYVATRPAGGHFGRPRFVARGQLRNLTIAMGPGGRLLTVWEDEGRLRVRYRGRTQTLRSKPAFTQALQARVTASGRAVVAWDAQAVSEGGTIDKGYVQVAVRGAHAARFGTARLLDTIPPETLVNGMALDGDRVAWSGWNGTQYVVRTATTSGPVTDVATGNLHVDALAGSVLAFTRDRYEDAGTVFAADLSDGTVAQLSTAPNAREAAVAGHTVVWVDRPGGRDRIESATPASALSR